jgi:hypothetical protein
MKPATEQSLRFLVDKWLAPMPAHPVRVTEFGRTRWGHTRYVRVEASLPGGMRSLLFFRHNDGCWCVFPPTSEKRKGVEPWHRAAYVLAVA